MKIGVFYHCKLAGEGIPDEDFAVSIMHEQMQALKQSGLAEAADEMHICVNGPDAQGLTAAALAPDNAMLHVNGAKARTELPTFALLRKWISCHLDWAVLYHHSKGVTQLEQGQGGRNDYKAHHRRVMEAAVVWNWKTCVKDLERGFDAVGVNWVDPITRPVLPGRFFAGNFWWARCDYLITLPPMPDNSPNYEFCERLLAEGWIGRSPRRPKVMDYERPELSAWCQSQIR